MSSRALKRQKVAREFLDQKQLKALFEWATNQKNPFRDLTPLLFDSEAIIRWRSIEALGKIATSEYQKDPDRPRRYIRRMLWLMNDESGGICWHAPEVIGEIIFNVPALFPEYARLLGSFFDLEPFEGGSRWAVARVAKINPDIFDTEIPKLVASVENQNKIVLGMSVLALVALNKKELIPKKFNQNQTQVDLYNFNSKHLEKHTISDILSQNITNIF